MATSKTIKVTTVNKKITDGQDTNIEVELDIQVPESCAEAAAEDFYGSEESLVEAVQGDWATRVQNAIRAQLRDLADAGDYADIAAQVASQYRPGRRGGFARTVSEDALSQFESVEEMVAYLKKQGLVAAR
jgi:hypothetical protein